MMLRWLSFASTICSIFALSWLMTRLNSPLNCINSSLVEKIVIYDIKPTESTVLGACNFQERLFGPTAPELVRKTRLFQRLERLEMVAPYLDFADVPITVHILNQPALELRLDGPILSLSHDALIQPGLLEKTLLFMKLNNSNPMTATISADFLWSELIAREKLDERVASWPQYFRNLRDYCKSEHVMPLHIEYCNTHNSLADSFVIEHESDASAAPWAMKPLYADLLRKLYRSLDMNDKERMLSRLIFLGEISDDFIEENSLDRNIFDLDRSYSQMLQDWLMPLLLPQEKYSELIAEQTFAREKPLNYLIVGRSSRNFFSFDEQKSIVDPKALKEPLVVQYGTQKYFYPNHLPLKFDRAHLFNAKKIKYFVFVACALPAVEDLLDYSSLTQSIIYIRQCQSEEVDWRQVAEQGLGSYLKNNLKVQFVEFNLKALTLAKKVRGPLRDTDNFVSWQKWLLWQKIERDESGSLVQRPLSAIDGVRRFRIF
jgi:hypothetical protein